MRWWETPALILLAVLPAGKCLSEHFSEGLSLRPLRDGRLAAQFTFRTVLENAVPRTPESLGKDDDSQHYTLIPLSLGQILREYAITELHLTLNAGKWDYSRWGYPEEAGVGTGAELWAWMGDGADASIDERWKGLRHAIAGLFCASLGSMDEQRTTSPSHAFKPEGSLPRFNHKHQLRHASLPSENVCTENLTPFLKLLPCKSSSGLASLLNPHKLFDADWHGIGVHVLWSQDEGVVVRLSFQAVFDPVRTSILQQKRDWSFKSLFDRTVNQPCAAASEGLVHVTLPHNVPYAISPEPDTVLNDRATYSVNESAHGLDISMQWPEEDPFTYPLNATSTPLTDLTIQRTLTGPTQSQGQLSIAITNHLDTELRAIYLETVPWIVQFYLHTMHLSVNGDPRNDLMSLKSYIPPVAHGRPMLFEFLLVMPPQATLHLTLDVSKSFLRYTEHPPDAQRGWDLPPAVLVPLPTSDTAKHLPRHPGHGPTQRMYTPALLVDLATPDFSMPYNVIIMSSTLIALIFGSLFNILTRKFVILNVRTPNGVVVGQ